MLIFIWHSLYIHNHTRTPRDFKLACPISCVMSVLNLSQSLIKSKISLIFMTLCCILQLMSLGKFQVENNKLSLSAIILQGYTILRVSSWNRESICRKKSQQCNEIKLHCQPLFHPTLNHTRIALKNLCPCLKNNHYILV